MKQLVFALMLETLTADGLVIETEEYGVWADVNKCTYFSRSISLQGVKAQQELHLKKHFLYLLELIVSLSM
jgi:hypothetical protein